jgi:GT2 family glycosyltransferase
MLENNTSVFTIILNWNQFQMTLECLESLRLSDYPNNTILLVDNGSKDGSCVEIPVHFPEVIMLCQPENLGFCEGNNVGIRYAIQQGADYILLLNNDTVIASDMIRKLVDACEADSANGMAGPTMFYHEQPERIAAAGSRVDYRSARFWHLRDGEENTSFNSAEVEEVDFIISCGVLVRRETIEKIGLLDNRYFINGDDIDWGLRAKAAGYQVLYVPEAKMWHKISATMGQFSPATVYYMTRNSFLLFSTHSKGWQRPLAFTLNSIRTLRTVFAWSVNSKYRNMKRHRQANLLAMRDAILGRYGKMGQDVAEVCYPKR